MRKESRISLCLLLLILMLSCPILAWSEEDDWEQILSSINTEVLQVNRQSLQLQKSLSTLLEEVHEPFVEDRKRFRQLEAILRHQSGNPLEARNVLLRLNYFRYQLEKDISPFSQIKNQAANFSGICSRLDKDLTDVGENITPDLQPKLIPIMNRLKETSARVNSIDERVSSILEAGQQLREDLSIKHLELIETLPLLWKAFFLDSSGMMISPRTWEETGPILQAWADTLPHYFLPTREQGKEIIEAALVKLVIIFIPLLIAGSVLFRKIFPEELSRKIFPSWVLFCFSLYLLVLSLGMIQSRTVLLNMAAHVMMALSLARLAWTIRLTLHGKPMERLPNPYYYILFTLAVFFLHSTAPTQVVGTLWSLTLIACAFLSFKITRDRPFLLNKTLAYLAPWVFFLLSAVSISGWSNIAIIVFMGLFYLILGLEIALSFDLILKKIVDGIPDEKIYALLKALLMGLGIPLAWMLIFTLMGIWFSTHMGGIFYLIGMFDVQVGWGGISFNLMRIVLVIAFFYLAMAAISIVKSTLHQMAFTWSKISPNAVPSIQTLSTYAVWVIFFFVALKFMGVSLTAFAVIAGGLSVGIGFGMQNLINNFVSGLILLIGRAIKPGDIVQLGDLWGTVIDINIRTTTVQSFDKAIIIVPNSDLIAKQLTNWTSDNRIIRRDLNVGVAYGSDTQKVQELLLRVASENPHITKDPAPSVIFSNFGDSSLDFILRVHVEDINYSLSAISAMRFEVDRVFRENDIEIAFPQMDLHLRSAPALRALQQRGSNEAEKH